MAINIQDLLTRGIDAWAETQQVKYQANAPVSYNRDPYGNYSTPEGQPAFDTLTATLSNPVNLMLLGAAAVLGIVLLRR